MYACASVYVFGCYVCTVSVFKKTFTGANAQHEEGNNQLDVFMCSSLT